MPCAMVKPVTCAMVKPVTQGHGNTSTSAHPRPLNHASAHAHTFMHAGTHKQLFPFSPLSLHLFEPRYKVMCKRIVNGSRKFAYLPCFHSYTASVGDVGGTSLPGRVSPLSLPPPPPLPPVTIYNI